MKKFLTLLLFLFCSNCVFAQTAKLDFDNPRPPGASGSRLPALFGGIAWPQTAGSGWAWEGAWSADPTAHVYFDSSAGTARSLTFITRQVLAGLTVFGNRTGTLTITDDAGQRLMFAVTATGRLFVVTTGWTLASGVVTFTYTAGWELGFDDLLFGPGGGQPPVNVARGVSEALRLVDAVTCGSTNGQPCVITEKLTTVALAVARAVRERTLDESLVTTDAADAVSLRQLMMTLDFPLGGTIAVVGAQVVWRTSTPAGARYVIRLAVAPDGTILSVPEVVVTAP